MPVKKTENLPGNSLLKHLILSIYLMFVCIQASAQLVMNGHEPVHLPFIQPDVSGPGPCIRMPGKSWVITMQGTAPDAAPETAPDKGWRPELTQYIKWQDPTDPKKEFQPLMVDDRVSSHTVLSEPDAKPDHILYFPTGRQHLMTEGSLTKYSSTAHPNGVGSSGDDPDPFPRSNPVTLRPPSPPELHVVANQTRITPQLQPCKPLLMDINFPLNYRVTESERISLSDGFLWVFLDSNGTPVIYPDPENPPARSLSVHNHAQARCSLTVSSGEEKLTLIRQCDEHHALTGSDKPYAVSSNALITLRMNSEGRWVVQLHVPGEPIRELSVEEYLALRSIFWEHKIAAEFGELPLFAYGPRRDTYVKTVKRPFRISRHPIKVKGDKSTQQPVADGNSISTSGRSGGEGKHKTDNENNGKVSASAPANEPQIQTGEPSRRPLGRHIRTGKPEPASVYDNLQNTYSDTVDDSVIFWALRFMQDIVKKQDVSFITEEMEKLGVAAPLTTAATKILSQTLTPKEVNKKSLGELLKIINATNGWAELLTESGLTVNHHLLNTLQAQKLQKLGETTKKEQVRETPVPMNEGWGHNPHPRLSQLEKEIASLISEATRNFAPVATDSLDCNSATQKIELNFHDTTLFATPGPGGLSPRKYPLINSNKSFRKIAKNYPDKAQALNQKAIDKTLRLLYHNQSDTAQMIRQIVTQLPEIIAPLNNALSSTPIHEGLLERLLLLGWSNNGVRCGMTLVPGIEVGSLVITRYQANMTVIEVDISTPPFTPPEPEGFPENIHLSKLDPIRVSGLLRIAIQTTDDHPSIYGGSLSFADLEWSQQQISQRTQQLATAWYDTSNSMPDHGLSSMITELIGYRSENISENDSIDKVSTLINISSSALNRIRRLQAFQTTLQPVLFRQFLTEAEQGFSAQWQQIHRYMKAHIVTYENSTSHSELFTNLLPFYEAVPRLADQLTESAPLTQEAVRFAGAAEITQTVLQIIKNKHELAQAVSEIRGEGKAEEVKANFTPPKAHYKGTEQKDILLLSSYAFLANSRALARLAKDFQTLSNQYPELRSFKDFGNDPDKQLPDNLKARIEAALRKGKK